MHPTLRDESVEVGVSWSFNIEIATTYIIDGLVVHHEGAVRVLQGGVGGQDGVVGLNHGCGHLGSWVHRKFQFGFLAIIN